MLDTQNVVPISLTPNARWSLLELYFDRVPHGVEEELVEGTVHQQEALLRRVVDGDYGGDFVSG